VVVFFQTLNVFQIRNPYEFLNLNGTGSLISIMLSACRLYWTPVRIKPIPLTQKVLTSDKKRDEVTS